MEAPRAIEHLRRLPIRVDDQPSAPCLPFSLALQHDLSNYDAVYLELGLRLQLPIAPPRTKDLSIAARSAGIGEFEP